MNILVIGSKESFSECEQKFGSTNRLTHAGSHAEARRIVNDDEVIFDFAIGENAGGISVYENRNATIFLNATKTTLRHLIDKRAAQLTGNHFFGFNGLPTFILSTILEVSLYHRAENERLQAVCQRLGTDFALVDDQIGLVTPRVIRMIINEAYFTVHEKTASREDIALAMKLGTNYPLGPFEWCKQIGIRHVYELLEAIFNDTKDDRYKICPLLRDEYLQIQR